MAKQDNIGIGETFVSAANISATCFLVLSGLYKTQHQDHMAHQKNIYLDDTQMQTSGLADWTRTGPKLKKKDSLSTGTLLRLSISKRGQVMFDWLRALAHILAGEMKQFWCVEK